ncbi:MAG: glycoside hydrolase domain-containing protein [Candidatus Omnitrophota bacterium]
MCSKTSIRIDKVLFVIIVLTHIFLGVIPACAQEVPSQYEVWGKQISRMNIPKGLKEVQDREDSEYLFTNAERKNGYVIFFNNYLDLVYYHTLPNADSIKKKLETSIALGEYEPMTFSVRSLEDLKNVTVTASDLKGRGKDLIAKENIDIRVVRHVPVLKKNKADRFSYKPIVLEKRETCNITKGKTKRFWITIYVSRDTAPGKYTGKIKFQPEKKKADYIPIEVEVLPILLKDPQRRYGIYYNNDNRWEGFYPENINKHFADIREHGLSVVTLYGVPEIKKTEDGLELDFSTPGFTSSWSIETFLENYTQAGLKGPLIFMGLDYLLRFKIASALEYEMYTKEFDQAYKELVKKIQENAGIESWPELIFSPVDEPATDSEKMRTARCYLQLLKEAIPDAQTYITCYGGWKGIDDAKVLDEWLDIRCYDWLNEQFIQQTRKARDKLWVYNGGSFGRNPVLDRFFYGFYAECIGADGVMQWGYQWPKELGVSPYDELKVGAQGWYYTYPTAWGPIPTAGWEGVREGVDDARYVATLKALISEVERVGTPEFIEKAEAAKKIIKDILKNIDIDSQTAKRYEIAINITNNSAQFDQWRQQIITEIISLQKALKKNKPKEKK